MRVFITNPKANGVVRGTDAIENKAVAETIEPTPDNADEIIAKHIKKKQKKEKTEETLDKTDTDKGING